MRELQQIADRYNKRWPTRPPLVISGDWLYGVWMIGNDYRNKTTYWGGLSRKLP